ncbi:hypothetical protein PHYPSEUDO_015407 [Phytophthora pseudosyringae]|uniref:Uncharacterized protein n=1 Tax=Phytophthora pseudosyringae TaxID=221518 RepID=A0A8T1V6J6_9STRA|nr:hypothetical protein PHYPSEUDO_015407 [Phytophthora pseudosyringae]
MTGSGITDGGTMGSGVRHDEQRHHGQLRRGGSSPPSRRRGARRRLPGRDPHGDPVPISQSWRRTMSPVEVCWRHFGELSDQGCIYTVEVDPTLPNITTISTRTTAPTAPTAPTTPLFTKVGTSIVSKEIPTQAAVQYLYIGKSTTSSTRVTTPATKSGTTPSAGKTGTTTGTASPFKTGTTTSTTPSTGSVRGEADTVKPKDCTTGWEDSTTTQGKMEKKRRLEANTNKDIAKLDAYFATSMEMTLKNLPTEGVHTPSPWPGPY